MLYVVTYTLSCFTKHSPNWNVLMVGRLLGGIATSLLFSAFESWLVAEHFKRGFSESLLGDIFSRAVFLGNGLTAIVAGFLGNYLVDSLGLGRVAPFDAASVFMIIGGGVIMATWTENYGDVHQNNISDQFTKAARAIMQGKHARALALWYTCSRRPVMPVYATACMPLQPDVNHNKHCSGCASIPIIIKPISDHPATSATLQTRRSRCWASCSRSSRPLCTPLCSSGHLPSTPLPTTSPMA